MILLFFSFLKQTNLSILLPNDYGRENNLAGNNKHTLAKCKSTPQPSFSKNMAKHPSFATYTRLAGKQTYYCDIQTLINMFSYIIL